MKQMKKGGMTDTDSFSGNERVIGHSTEQDRHFDYKYLCKNVIKISKSKMDSYLLVPLKLYNEQKNNWQENEGQLEEWMDAFIKKEKDIIYFWIYLSYDGGYKEFIERDANKALEECIRPGAVKSAKNHMNDVSKLENSNYMKKLCERRDKPEYWILKMYELTFRRLYSVEEMTLLIKTVIDYLRQCKIKINEPTVTSTDQGGEHIFQVAANLMLFVTRLRLEVEKNIALNWYRKGNVAFFQYRDQMLEEYIHLMSQYSYQSYERFKKMEEIAQRDKNKYAAKEVGDVYRCGMETQDYLGNRIYINVNDEKACEFYRICMDTEYIPAYISAVKTGVLIDDGQKKSIIERAMEDDNPESLAYYAEQCIKDADERHDHNVSLELLSRAANALIRIEDAFVVKHVLKNALLLSKAFRSCKNDKCTEKGEAHEAIQKLYSQDIWSASDDMILAEIEKTYLLVKDQGYFKAEYQLGNLFREIDAEKSMGYFEQGKEKGCLWCTFEFAKIQRNQAPKKWLQTMIGLGRQKYTSEEFQQLLAGEWSECEVVLEQISSGEITLKREEIVELYIQISDLYKNVANNTNRTEDFEEINNYVELLSKLSENRSKIEKLL